MILQREKDFDGIWGKPTATIDWCEANYEVTFYIAEFWNTISNVFMILLPLWGCYYGIRDKIEARYIWCYIAIFFVGVGSWMFHGTLLYQSQLLDELPMIWGSSFLIYSLKEVSTKKGQPNIKLIILLFVYCSVVTIVYLTINEPVFHEVAYGLMVFSMIYYSAKILRYHRHSYTLFKISIILYALGFFMWNLDNIFCDKFRGVRVSMGYPLKPLIQGHAWWHVFVGISTYLSLLFSIHARACYLRNKTEIKIPLGILPLVRVHEQS